LSLSFNSELVIEHITIEEDKSKQEEIKNDHKEKIINIPV
jgi:hypothetical protein